MRHVGVSNLLRRFPSLYPHLLSLLKDGSRVATNSHGPVLCVRACVCVCVCVCSWGWGGGWSVPDPSPDMSSSPFKRGGFSLLNDDDVDEAVGGNELAGTRLDEARQHLSSDTRTFVNLLISFVGAGILSIPYAFRQVRGGGGGGTGG